MRILPGWLRRRLLPTGSALRNPGRRSPHGHADVQPAYFAASRSFQAIAEWNVTHDVPLSSVEINLGLMNMDSPVDDSSAPVQGCLAGVPQAQKPPRVTLAGHPLA